MRNAKSMLVRVNVVFLAVFTVAVAYLLTNSETVADRSLYSGKEDHIVTLNQAKEMTAAFQQIAGDNDLIAGYFGRSAFDQILAQDKCVGVRIYNAKEASGKPTFVLVGVDAKGDDIVNGIVAEDVAPCPPFCGTPTELTARGNVIAMRK